MNRNWLFLGIIFVALGVRSRAGDLQYSNVTSGVSARLNAVAFGGTSNFAAVATNSTVLAGTLGPAGLFWTTTNVPTAGLNLGAVTYGNGMFVAGAQNAAVFSSAVGLNWASNGSAFGGAVAIPGLTFNTGSNGTFVAVADALAISWADANLAAWHVAKINNGAPFEQFKAVTSFRAKWNGNV